MEAERAVLRSSVPDDVRPPVRALFLARGLAGRWPAAARRRPAGRDPRRADPRPVRHPGPAGYGVAAAPGLARPRAAPGPDRPPGRRRDDRGHDAALNRFARALDE